MVAEMACLTLVLTSFAIASFLPTGESGGEATLKLTPHYPSVGSDLLLECSTAVARNVASVEVIYLEKIDDDGEVFNVYSETYKCAKIKMQNPHPRISQANSTKIELRWTTMSQLDTGLYACSVHSCDGKRDSSPATQITVIAPPTYASIIPASDITAKEGSQISLNITCHANVGFPNGSLSLTRSTNGVEQLLELTLQSVGSVMMTGTYSITEVAARSRSKHDDWFECKAFNQLDPSKAVIDIRYVKVNYRPSQLQVSSVPVLPELSVESKSTARNATATVSVTVSVPSGQGVTILCRSQSEPLSQLSVKLLSGKKRLVWLKVAPEKATIKVNPTNTTEELKVRCTAIYASAAYPELNTTLTTDIIIYIGRTVRETRTKKTLVVKYTLLWIIGGVTVVYGFLLFTSVFALFAWCTKKKKNKTGDTEPNAAAGKVSETVVQK